MKKIILSLACILAMASFISPSVLASSPDDGIVSVSGTVRDSHNRRVLENVVVSVSGSNISVVTNADGVFVLKIPASVKANAVIFSHIGYVSMQYPLNGNKLEDISVMLTSTVYPIKEIYVRLSDPMKIVQEAIKRMATNYSNENDLLTIFYRETARKRNAYINISEAVAYIHKTPYTRDVSNDLVEMYKGRRLVSPKPSDTLAVKLLGGINVAAQLDVVKNHDVIFNDILEGLYHLELDAPALIEDKPHYVVKFTPALTTPFPLLYGRLFVDQETYTVSRAEFNVNMDDKAAVERMMVRRKPLGLRFEPEEISYLVTYRESGGISYISYVRSEYKFKCDWRKKLFSSRYTIVSETVITDVAKVASHSIKRRDAVNANQSLEDRVEYFNDPGYWEDFNIIEPTESLETGVRRLRKKQ